MMNTVYLQIPPLPPGTRVVLVQGGQGNGTNLGSANGGGLMGAGGQSPMLLGGGSNLPGGLVTAPAGGQLGDVSGLGVYSPRVPRLDPRVFQAYANQPGFQPSTQGYPFSTGFGTRLTTGGSYADYGNPGILGFDFPPNGVDPGLFFAPAAYSGDLPALLAFSAGLGLPLRYSPPSAGRVFPPGLLGQPWPGSTGTPFSPASFA
jgi:hypothetical protein